MDELEEISAIRETLSACRLRDKNPLLRSRVYHRIDILFPWAADVRSRSGRSYRLEPPPQTMRILVAGVGNRLRRDDGFGPRVVDLLSELSLPENVELRDVGTAGLTIATDLSDYDAAIFLDTMDVEGEPGRLYKAEVEIGETVDDVGELARMTLHEVGLEGLLRFSSAIGTLPPKVILIGCKPKVLSAGIGLSPEVEMAAERAVDMVLDTLRGLRREDRE